MTLNCVHFFLRLKSKFYGSGNMYPVTILPNKKYKTITADVNDYFLIRHALLNDNDTLLDTTTGHIKENYISSPKEYMQDLSTSLLGHFDPTFIEIELIKKGKELYNHYCNPDDSVKTPIKGIHYISNTSRTFWTIKIGDVNNHPVQFQNVNGTFTANCQVLHTPMKWNYWHFSIRWFLPANNTYWNELPDDQKKKAPFKKWLAHESRVLIKTHAKDILPNMELLPSNHYMKVG